MFNAYVNTYPNKTKSNCQYHFNERRKSMKKDRDLLAKAAEFFKELRRAAKQNRGPMLQF